MRPNAKISPRNLEKWERARSIESLPPWETLPVASDRPDEEPAFPVTREQLGAAIEALPPRLRSMLRARLHGESLESVGVLHGGVSKERVRQLLLRATEMLRERLAGVTLPAS